MQTKKTGSHWTAYCDPGTGRYFAEILYISREGIEQYDYEITQDVFARLGTFAEEYDNVELIKTGNMTYSLENTMYGTLGPERRVRDEEGYEAMMKLIREEKKPKKKGKGNRSGR